MKYRQSVQEHTTFLQHPHNGAQVILVSLMSLDLFRILSILSINTE